MKRYEPSRQAGPRLVTFFAVMYYAGLRPEEAIYLASDNVILPPPVWDEDSHQWHDPPDDGEWGELHIRSATPDAGREWTDDGSARERRQLKHRAEGDSRIVPTHPELTRLLRDHLAKFDPPPNGLLFSGVRGAELPTITYRRAWIGARQVALTSAEQASPPLLAAHSRTSNWQARSRRGQAFPQVTRPDLQLSERVGGWDSNPGPADYESSKPATCPIRCDLGERDLRDHGRPDLGTYLA